MDNQKYSLTELFKNDSSKKFTLPVIFAILILGLLVIIYLLNIFLGRDISPIDDSDLWLSKIEIPTKENAFYLLSEASKKISLPIEKTELFEKMANGENWDLEFAEKLIEQNKEVFDYFEKAIALPYFQIIQLQDPKTIDFEIPIPSLSGFRNIAKLNSIKANYLLIQGKEKEALDLIFKTIKIGQMMEDSPRPFIISYLTGMNIKEVGLQRLRITIPHLTLSSEKLKDYIIQLEQFKLNEEGLIKTMKMEYISFNNTKLKIDAAFAGKPQKQELEKLDGNEILGMIKWIPIKYFYYKPNQTQKLFAKYYRNFVNNVNKDCYYKSLIEIKPLVPQSKIKMLFTENLVGKIFYDAVALNYASIFDKKCVEDFSVTGTQILMALKAYQIKNGKIPSSLEEIVPEYLPELPKDPFDVKVIKYLPEKKIIYSVGKDLKDSQGNENEDLVFKIEF